MSGINHIGEEEISRRKTISDAKSDTDDLTFENSSKHSSHGSAALSNRNRISEAEINALERSNDASELEQLFKEIATALNMSDSDIARAALYIGLNEINSMASRDTDRGIEFASLNAVKAK